MTDYDPEMLEAELKRLKPAKPPQNFMVGLNAVIRPTPSKVKRRLAPIPSTPIGWQLLRWLSPATAGAALIGAALLWWPSKPDLETARSGVVPPAKTSLEPNAVQIDREWVGAYDAVAELPGGEPVRFRCQEWMDAVVLRDAASGVRVEQRTPRFEIVAARLDTF